MRENRGVKKKFIKEDAGIFVVVVVWGLSEETKKWRDLIDLWGFKIF